MRLTQPFFFLSNTDEGNSARGHNWSKSFRCRSLQKHQRQRPQDCRRFHHPRPRIEGRSSWWVSLYIIISSIILELLEPLTCDRGITCSRDVLEPPLSGEQPLLNRPRRTTGLTAKTLFDLNECLDTSFFFVFL